MRAVVRKSDLESLVTKAARCADDRSPIPILKNLLLTTDAGKLHVAGCDLNVAFEGSCDAAIESPGQTTTPAEDLLQRVKAMPDAPIVVELDGEKLSLKAKSRKHVLPTMPANHYPAIPTDKSTLRVLSLSSKALKTALDRVYRAIDKKATAAHFGAVHLWLKNERLEVAAVTSHRFLRTSIATPGEAPIDAAVMLAAKAVEDLRAQLTGDETIEVTIAQSWSAFRTSAGLYRAQLLLWEQERPFYEMIELLTIAQKKPVSVPRALALEVLKAVESFVNVRLTFKSGRIVVEAKGDDGRVSSDEIPVEYDGRERAIEVQTSYAIDLLSSCPAESMVDVEPMFFPRDVPLKQLTREDQLACSIDGEGAPCLLTLRSGEFCGQVAAVGQ